MVQKRIVDNKSIIAYLVGLALGDGNLSNPNGRAVRLRITCDLRYPKLLKRIIHTLQTIFPDNKVSMVQKVGNCVDVSCYSNRFEEILGWYADGGSKITQKVRVPRWIYADKIYQINCLRGLLETDGTIYYDRGYPMVMFVNGALQLARDVSKLISCIGFVSSFYNISRTPRPIYHVRLSKNVSNFLNLVKPMKA